MAQVFDIKYFIEKFSKIPEENWTTTYTHDTMGNMDVFGHCGVRDQEFTEEANALINLVIRDHVDEFEAALFLVIVNDGDDWTTMLGKTPKSRILNFLNEIYIKSSVKGAA